MNFGVRNCLFVVLLAAAAGLAVAAREDPPPLKIVGPEKVPAYALARFTAAGVPDKAALLWRITPTDKVDRATSPKGTLEFVAPPGRYLVELLAISQGAGGELVVGEARMAVEISPPPGGPGPMPPPKPPGGASAAIAKLRVGNSGCTIAAIAPRRPDGRWDYLTANHCVGAVGAKGTVVFKDGRAYAITSTGVAAAADLAWFVSDEPGPADLPCLVLALAEPAAGTAIWQAGYGFDRPTVRKDGSILAGRTGSGQLVMDLSVSNGDSGGPIMRADTDELVAIVCCTTGIGRKTQMFGGSSIQAAALRPKLADDRPVELPVVPRLELRLPLRLEGSR